MGANLSAGSGSDVFLHFQIIFNPVADNSLDKTEVLCPRPSTGLFALLTRFGFSPISLASSFWSETHSQVSWLLYSLFILFSRILFEVNFIEDCVYDFGKVIKFIFLWIFRGFHSLSSCALWHDLFSADLSASCLNHTSEGTFLACSLFDANHWWNFIYYKCVKIDKYLIFVSIFVISDLK